jgi:hypothetical protein
MYQLFTGNYAFGCDENVAERITKDPVKFGMKGWKNVSNEAKDLCELLLVKNQGNRISAGDALKH